MVYSQISTDKFQHCHLQCKQRIRTEKSNVRGRMHPKNPETSELKLRSKKRSVVGVGFTTDIVVGGCSFFLQAPSCSTTTTKGGAFYPPRHAELVWQVCDFPSSPTTVAGRHFLLLRLHRLGGSERTVPTYQTPTHPMVANRLRIKRTGAKGCPKGRQGGEKSVQKSDWCPFACCGSPNPVFECGRLISNF